MAIEQELRERWLGLLDALKRDVAGAAELCRQITAEAEEKDFGEGYVKACGDFIDYIEDIQASR